MDDFPDDPIRDALQRRAVGRFVFAALAMGVALVVLGVPGPAVLLRGVRWW